MMLFKKNNSIYNFFSYIFSPLLAIFVISLLIPFLIFIALLVILIDGRPIFFRSVRSGYKGNSFVLFKFRTMKDTNLEDEKRITKLGKLLRRSSLDELPQLINILKGEMVFVGPRPLPLEVLLKDKVKNSFKKRSSVKPGLTGLAQVFSKGTPRNFREKLKYDLIYIKKKSLVLDIIIIFMTFKVLQRRFKNNKSGKSL